MSDPGPAAEDTPRGAGPMRPPSARDPSPLRRQVFDHVRAQGRASRAEVARALGVSAASVTAATAELIGLRFLRETGPAPLDRPDSPRGRPPVALEIVPEGRPVIGVKLGDERHTAVLADFGGRVLAHAARDATPGRRPLAALVAEVAALIADLPAQPTPVAAIGIGLPGLVDHHAGRVAWSPLLDAPRPTESGSGDCGLDLRDALAARLRAPVQIDNDANLLALAELWFGAGRALSDFAVVTIEHGVGMGLVQGGRLQRGARGLGLELGHMKVRLDGALCRCGSRGCLEAYLADYALAREAATALGRDPGQPHSPRAMLETLFHAAKSGHEPSREIFARAGRHLALGLANLVQLLDPGLVILSGERMRYDFLYAEEVLAEMNRLALPQGRPPVPVEVHAWGDLVWAQGAAALALIAATDAALGA
ncbi:ROK family protein [Rubellimicrobium aerolatum]|uniref:ROK family protein n=1 Tax=Rubellimicrobium aerolatum TaxID=490979 RepID=A0ABW0SC41_9RHOB|nr:ROK family protein [Rubellimicrobium aerolatum]MBP1806014.1 putative NBD/HSP70 family sugar kinase [Rubellimicrobium aerolatum]